MMSKETWNGILIGTVLTAILAIPLNLLTGLLFPHFQKWLDTRAKARAFAKSKQMRAEYEEAHYFFTYPHRMTQYFLNRGLELFRLSVFLFFLLWAMPRDPVAPGKGVWGVISSLLPLAGAIFLLFSISAAVNKLHDIYYRAEFWGEYKKKVERELPEVAHHNDSITSSNE